MKMISELKGKKKTPAEIQAELDQEVEQMRSSIRDPRQMAQAK